LTGFFITFEGIEGCGKSTQARLLANSLENQGLNYILTREPGYGNIGEKIREILLSTKTLHIDPLTELLLLEADRNQHVKSEILPALDNDMVVVSDRYSDSSEAYQGFGRGIPRKQVQILNEIATGGVMPDLTFVMDLDTEVSLARSEFRLKQQDMFDQEGRFESENISFHKRVRAGYLTLAEENPNRIVLIDAMHPIEDLFSKIWDIIASKLNLK
jgi:dTMP kinase